MAKKERKSKKTTDKDMNQTEVKSPTEVKSATGDQGPTPASAARMVTVPPTVQKPRKRSN